MDRAFYDGEKNKEIENKYKISLAIPHKKDRNKKMTKKKELLYVSENLFGNRMFCHSSPTWLNKVRKGQRDFG